MLRILGHGTKPCDGVSRREAMRVGGLSVLSGLSSARLLQAREEIPSVRGIDILMGLGLTPREAVVTIWMVQGKKNHEIAVILGISTATIRKHVENILRKLQCETRGMVAQLVMQAVTERIVGAMPGKCMTCTKPACTSC